MAPTKSARKRAGRKPKSEVAQVERMYKTIHQTKRIYSRWMAGAEQSVTTSAGGVVALTTLANAAVINATPDFSSIAALYTAYRCKAIRVQVFAFYNTAVYTGAAVQFCPSAIVCFPWTSNTVPTTFQQALDVTGCKIKSGYSSFVISTSWKGDPDAHLWTGTGAAIGSSEQFGISCIGTATACTANLYFWKIIPEYLVEFRMVG